MEIWPPHLFSCSNIFFVEVYGLARHLHLCAYDTFRYTHKVSLEQIQTSNVCMSNLYSSYALCMTFLRSLIAIHEIQHIIQHKTEQSNIMERYICSWHFQQLCQSYYPLLLAHTVLLYTWAVNVSVGSVRVSPVQ